MFRNFWNPRFAAIPVMPRKVGLYKRRADSREWIKHDAWAIRETSKGIFDEVL